jgi:hypothetical protein
MRRPYSRMAVKMSELLLWLSMPFLLLLESIELSQKNLMMLE